ncbi:MAG: hypothetical protein KHX56_12800 [Clostridiales bacterium]|nr:hypothetical protein [Clostridiales bacterium]
MKKRLAKKIMKRQAEHKVEKKVSQAAAPEVIEKKAEAILGKALEKKMEAVQKKNAADKKEAVLDKAVVKKAEAQESKGGKKVNIFYQFSNHQVEQQDIVARIKNQWKEQGNMLKDLKDLVIYLKTEENKAYYIINENIKGFVAVCE